MGWLPASSAAGCIGTGPIAKRCETAIVSSHLRGRHASSQIPQGCPEALCSHQSWTSQHQTVCSLLAAIELRGLALRECSSPVYATLVCSAHLSCPISTVLTRKISFWALAILDHGTCLLPGHCRARRRPPGTWSSQSNSHAWSFQTQCEPLADPFVLPQQNVKLEANWMTGREPAASLMTNKFYCYFTVDRTALLPVTLAWPAS